MRAKWITGVLAALALAPAAQAQAAEITTVPVSIPASQPDDSGAPVVLDGGVTYPLEGCPCPGVIINHGFLGKWQDSRGITEELARNGYVVLRYSSRGFGETPGEVDLMGPKESRDLIDAVDWLNDPESPVVGGLVRRNRIGQFGGSYGGAHAWTLAASGHPAVRTTVPTATWTDLFEALVPNGVMLLAYANGFYATGFNPTAKLIEGELNADLNYSTDVHRWMLEANAGLLTSDMRSGLAERSVKFRLDAVDIPVFIVQGLNDGLFNANQAIDAYQALRERKVRARLYLGGIGHPPSDGSLDSPEAQHVGQQVLAWFDHHLKGIENGIHERPPIEFSRADYFRNRWDGTTRSAKRYPFGEATRLHLCTTGPSGGTLSGTACPGALPAAAVNQYAGPGYDSEPVTAQYAQQLRAGVEALTAGRVDSDRLPGVLTYEGPALADPLDLAGVPELSLRVASASVLPVVPDASAAAFQLDPKLWAVGPDGKAKLLTRGAFSEPLGGNPSVPSHKVDFEINGVSTVVPAGHRLRLTLQTADAPYLRPTPNPFAAVLFPGSAVELPTVAPKVEEARRSRTSRASRASRRRR